MKKRQITIEETINPLGAYTITIHNARYQKCFLYSIQKIFNAFFVDEDLFFGFYRTDGMNLTLKQQKKLRNEIPAWFRKHGDMQNLTEYLSVAKIKLNDYNIIPLIFDYYLETTLFNPKASWETFKHYHLNYQKHRFEDVILNNIAEVLFFYFDSGDFSICFNPKIYNLRDVRNIIDEFFEV